MSADDAPVDVEADPAVEIEEKAPLLKDWMIRKNCWCSEMYDVLVEEGYDDPTKVKEISEETMERMKNEVLTEFTDVNVTALNRFEACWLRRTAGPRQLAPDASPTSSPGTSPRRVTKGKKGRGRGRGRGKGKSKSPGTRSRPTSTRGQVGAGFSANPAGEMRRFLKKHSAWQIEFEEYLIQEAGITDPDELIAMSRDEFAEMLKQVELYYARQVQSSMQRNRFNKNLTNAKKMHRKLHGIDRILSDDILASASTVDQGVQLNVDRELINFLRDRKVWSPDWDAIMGEKGIITMDDFVYLTEDQIDELLRDCKNFVLKNTKTQHMIQKADTRLANFKKAWRQQQADAVDDEDVEYADTDPEDYDE